MDSPNSSVRRFLLHRAAWRTTMGGDDRPSSGIGRRSRHTLFPGSKTMNTRRTWFGLALCFLVVVDFGLRAHRAAGRGPEDSPSIDMITRSYPSVTTPANA